MRKLIGLLLLLLSPAWLEAATKYVVPGTCTNAITTYNPAGAGSCTGGSSTVYSSIPNAQTTGSPGDIFDIRGGTYTSGWTSAITSGSAGNLITWQGHSGETVTVSVSSSPAINLFDSNDHHITFKSLTIDQNSQQQECGSFGESVVGNGPDFIRVESVICRETGKDGFLLRGTNLEFVNNTFVQNGDHTDSPATHGIYATEKNTTVLIDGNNFSNCGDYCVQFYDSTSQTTGVTIRNNVFHDIADNPNFGEGPITIRGVTGALIYNNLMYDFTTSQGSTSCISLLSSSGTKVYNNTCYGNGANTAMQLVAGANNAILKNNIFYNFNDYVQNLGTGTSFATNFCGAADTGCLVTGNPQFVNTATDDYHLLAGSSAIGAGSVLTEFSTDIVGTSRPQGINWDIGAYEYISPPAALTLLSPNGGESFSTGSTQSVLWSSNGAGATVEITEDQDGNGSYETTISASTANDGSHSYTVTGSANASRKMKVKDTAAATNDVSDAVYAVTSSTPGTITVTYPTAGVHFFPGQTLPISWTSAGISGNVNVFISYTNGTFYEATAIVANHPFNQPDATWVVSGPSGTTIKVKVVSVNDGAVVGESAAFKIAGTYLYAQ